MRWKLIGLLGQDGEGHEEAINTGMDDDKNNAILNANANANAESDE